VPVNELTEIEAFDEETVEELRTRARNALLTEAIKREENLEQAERDLIELEGMDADLLTKLAAGSIRTRDDLAELAVDELTEMTGIEDERAKSADHGRARALVRRCRTVKRCS
jgi:transcription termination/antitermination protein NusA